MASRDLDFPVFDSDHHLYETRDALTRYLPDKYKGAIDYVDVHGRTKILVRGKISNYIPKPDIRSRRSARGAGGVLQARQPGWEISPRDNR